MFFNIGNNSISDSIIGHSMETLSFSLATASVQGKRSSNEDAEDFLLGEKYTFFAIYDGHGGDSCSKYLKQYLLDELNNLTEITPEKIKQVFQRIDLGYRRIFPSAGSTAVVAIMDNEHQQLMIVNLGDSRAMIVRNGEIIYETVDHTPNSERERISRTGYFVIDNRICGTLALSRAFGDFEYKEDPMNIDNYGVSIIPDVSGWIQLMENDLIILNCDGLNECDHQNNKIMAVISDNLKKNNLLGTVIKTICNGLEYSDDNISLMIIKIAKNEKPPLKINLYIPGLTKNLLVEYNRAMSFIETGKKNKLEFSDMLMMRKKLLIDFFEGYLDDNTRAFFTARYGDRHDLLQDELIQLSDQNWITKLVKKIRGDISDNDFD